MAGIFALLILAATVTGATAAGIWQASVAGFQRFRVNCPTTYVSGTAVVTLSPSLASF